MDEDIKDGPHNWMRLY
ncbi:hypothetical protein LINPERPRIM_LOCUS22446 [Linum perenne]